MSRNHRFTFLCNEQERQLIRNLAFSLHRTQSDAIRYLIVQAMSEIQKLDQRDNADKSSGTGKENSPIDINQNTNNRSLTDTTNLCDFSDTGGGGSATQQ